MLKFWGNRKNNSEDYIVKQSSGLEEKKLDSVTGKKLFKDTKFMVRESLLILLLIILA